MKLNKNDLKVLSAVELNADLALETLCKFTSLKIHTVRYILGKLSSHGIISQKRPIVGNEALGYFFTTLFFSLSSRKQRRKHELVSFLASNPMVSWVFELGGDYQYGASFKVRHVSEIRQFLEILAKKFGNIFFEKGLSTQLSFIYFGRRYLSASKHRNKPISFSVDEKVQEIDEIDKNILEGLTERSYSSRSELAQILKIPGATFERRRLQLEKQGIIKGYFYWIDPEKLGVHSFVIMLFAQGISLEVKSRLRAYAESEPAVVYMTEAMGQWDFELGVEVPSARDITQITEHLYDLFPEEIRTIRVVPILSYLKVKNHKLRGNVS
jgi:DNA-binding Lrp family transcriptional regulator